MFVYSESIPSKTTLFSSGWNKLCGIIVHHIYIYIYFLYSEITRDFFNSDVTCKLFILQYKEEDILK